MIARKRFLILGVAILTAGAVSAKAKPSGFEEGFCKTPNSTNQKFKISGTVVQWDPDLSGLFAVADLSGPVMKYWMLEPLNDKQQHLIAGVAGTQVTLSVKCIDYRNFDYVSILKVSSQKNSSQDRSDGR